MTVLAPSRAASRAVRHTPRRITCGPEMTWQYCLPTRAGKSSAASIAFPVGVLIAARITAPWVEVVIGFETAAVHPSEAKLNKSRVAVPGKTSPRRTIVLDCSRTPGVYAAHDAIEPSFPSDSRVARAPRLHGC
jgi:hypothetical protein